MSRVQNEQLEFSPSATTPISFRRAEAIATVIDKSRLACGLLPLEKNHLKLAVIAWDEILSAAKVPTERINDAYKVAMSKHSTKQPFAVAEICSEWQEMKKNEAARRRFMEARSRKNCVFCEGTGIKKVAGPDFKNIEMECDRCDPPPQSQALRK